jgi:hypothetical protein
MPRRTGLLKTDRDPEAAGGCGAPRWRHCALGGARAGRPDASAAGPVAGRRAGRAARRRGSPRLAGFMVPVRRTWEPRSAGGPAPYWCCSFVIIGPKGPEPALARAFSKKNRIVPLWSFCSKQQNNKSFAPTSPGRANVFPNVTFSFTLHYRSGRKAQLALKDPGRHFPVPYSFVLPVPHQPLAQAPTVQPDERMREVAHSSLVSQREQMRTRPAFPCGDQ